jgi:hypothetical protein
VRYDPFDISIGYAYIDGVWRQCFTPYDEFAGCSERELQLLASEVRQNNRIQYGREQVEINQKQLASFRRENGAKEAILRQQRKDQEMKSALTVLEGRATAKITSSLSAHPEDAKGSGQRQDAQPAGARPGQEKKHEKLLVFKRIRS